MWSPSFKLRSEQLNICLRRRTSLGLSCRLLENTQTAASPTTQSLQWTDIQVSDEELEADKAVPGICSIVWGGLWLWSHVKQCVGWFPIFPNQTCYSISLITPDFHPPHKTPSNISPLTLGSLYFLQGPCFLPSSPCTLASLWPLIPDTLIPICIFLTYVGGIQGLNMRPSIVFPLTKGVSHILFSLME